MDPAQTSNLARLLTHTAQLFPERAGLIQGEARWSWGEIEQRVAAMTAALRSLGLRKGDRILVHSRNHRAMFESCWVAFRLGCVWVPTNFRLAPPEVAYLASSSGAVAMMVEDVFPAHTDAARAASPALRHVIAIGNPREGELAYEDLVAQHLHQAASQAAAHEVVAHDDPLWFFYTSG
ncbi:AMP-binding protein, partial [Roseateles sp.]|uniref:AMP-binding protein n=1 Tax=Roseateles sp. TaxID=1971397 RepID=UPI003BA83C70